MSRTCSFLFVICSLCLSVSAQVVPEPMTLVPGQSVERQIAGGESHTYQLPLTAGEFIRFRLAQRGIDATLILTAPNGKQLVEMNLTRAGDQESLSLEAAAAGGCRLTVRCGGVAVLRGAYRLEAAVQATATAQDRKRPAAEAMLIEVEELRKGARTATASQQMIDKAQQALPIWRELGEPSWTAWSLRYIGTGYERLSQYEKAIESFEQALALFREAKNQAGIGRALYHIGVAYGFWGRYEKALAYYEQALPIIQEVRDRFGEGELLRNRGLLIST